MRRKQEVSGKKQAAAVTTDVAQYRPCHRHDGCRSRRQSVAECGRDDVVLVHQLFLAFLVGMLAAAIYGYVNGDPYKLIAPIDGAGNICGFDPGYVEYPKLYIANIIKAAENPHEVFNWGVCVKECPESNTDDVECMTTPPNLVTVCNPGQALQYGTKDIVNYCYPVYDSLPQ